MELSNWSWTSSRSKGTEGVGFYTTNGISIAEQIILGSELISEKQLVTITDMLGRNTKLLKNIPLFYIYDDGTVEKKIIIE